MTTFTEQVAHFATTTYVLDVPEPAEHTRTMETASNYDTFQITPGSYPVRMTNIDGSDWNPDPGVATPGYIANTGPYYAAVTVDATHTHRHIVNRLFTESRMQDEYPNTPATVGLSTYAYNVYDGAPGLVAGSTFRAV